MAIRTYDTSDISRWYQIAISSRNDDDKKANLTLIGFGKHLSIDIPDWIIKPVKVKHRYFNHERQEYVEFWVDEIREYGISIFEDHFSIRYGLQSGDSTTQKYWGKSIPWLYWRFCRWSLLNLDHSLFIHLENNPWGVGRNDRMDYDEKQKHQDNVPKIKFRFRDFDGEEGIATCFIEEREWRLGDGWFKWLSFFSKPKIHRDLDISYSIEVGPRKNSWKGGTVGTGHEIEANESVEEIFKKHCDKNELTYLGVVE